MRGIETAAAAEIGLPTLLMMENAAVRLTEHCLAYLKDNCGHSGHIRGQKGKPIVTIMAGIGGNGGDGLALARHLYLKGADVSVFIVGDIGKVRGDTFTNLEIIRKMGLPVESIPLGDNIGKVPQALESSDLVVDALFGAGLNRHVEGSLERIIEMINRYAGYVISVDMPSGVSADTGQILGAAVKADVTVTLGFPKIGLMIYPGAAYAGRVEIADICLPYLSNALTETDTSIFTDAEMKSCLPVRAPRTNKGSFGRVYAFTGSAGMPGAAVLSAAAAYRSGAGYVCACVVPDVARVIHGGLKEAVTRILPDRGGYFCPKSLDAVSDELSRADVVYVGPGIGQGAHVTEFVHNLLESVNTRMVIDADALNAIAENVNILKSLKAPCVITPHPGEMSRLTKLPVSDILGNTLKVAGEFAREFDVITVLKDARTIVASPEGNNYINVTGCPALAKAGTGDVLTGVIAGFMAQGLDSFTAAAAGAYIHGKAGELAGERLSGYGVLASDLLDYIPEVLNRY